MPATRPTNYQPVQPLISDTPGNVLTAADLEAQEIGINFADKKLFGKKSDGTVGELNFGEAENKIFDWEEMPSSYFVAGDPVKGYCSRHGRFYSLSTNKAAVYHERALESELIGSVPQRPHVYAKALDTNLVHYWNGTTWASTGDSAYSAATHGIPGDPSVEPGTSNDWIQLRASDKEYALSGDADYWGIVVDDPLADNAPAFKAMLESNLVDYVLPAGGIHIHDVWTIINNNDICLSGKDGKTVIRPSSTAPDNMFRLWRISTISGHITLKNMKLDGENKCAHVIESSNFDHVLKDFTLENVEIVNAYKRTTTSGSGASGVTIKGRYKPYINRCSIGDVSRDTGSMTPTAEACTGISIQRNGGTNYPIQPVIKNTKVSNITNNEAQTSLDNQDCDGISINLGAATITGEPTNADNHVVIENCTFENCKGRNIKTQCLTYDIRNINILYNNTEQAHHQGNGVVMINAQFGGKGVIDGVYVFIDNTAATKFFTQAGYMGVLFSSYIQSDVGRKGYNATIKNVHVNAIGVPAGTGLLRLIDGTTSVTDISSGCCLESSSVTVNGIEVDHALASINISTGTCVYTLNNFDLESIATSFINNFGHASTSSNFTAKRIVNRSADVQLISNIGTSLVNSDSSENIGITWGGETNKRIEWISESLNKAVYSNTVSGRRIDFDLLEGGNRSVNPMAYDSGDPTNSALNGYLNWQLTDEYKTHLYETQLAPYYFAASEHAPISVWALDANMERQEYVSIKGRTIDEYSTLSNVAWKRVNEPPDFDLPQVYTKDVEFNTSDEHIGNILRLTDISVPTLHEVFDGQLIGKSISFANKSDYAYRINSGGTTLIGAPIIKANDSFSATIIKSGAGTDTEWLLANGVEAPVSPDDFVFLVDANIAGGSGVEHYVLPSTNVAYSLKWQEVGSPAHNSGGPVAVTAANPDINFGTPHGSGVYRISVDPTGTSDFNNFNHGTNNTDKDKLLLIEQWGTVQFNDPRLMFNGCTNLLGFVTHDVPDFSAVTILNTGYMFNNCTNFKLSQNIGLWNMLPFDSLVNMFANCPVFNGNVGPWNVSNITVMQLLFRANAAFDQDLSGWDISAVTNLTDILLFCELSVENYGKLLEGWSVQVVQPGLSFHAGDSQYLLNSAAATSRDTLTNAPNTWTITDGGGI